MPKGTLVTIGIGAANRDPEPFPDPDRFDVARNPTRHLAFGSGIHMCAGMSLARLEGRIAIERFLARFPDYGPDGAPRAAAARAFAASRRCRCACADVSAGRSCRTFGAIGRQGCVWRRLRGSQ